MLDKSMNRLRALFLAPTAAVMIALFFVPLLIVFAYSVLTRGAYGGAMLPWTFESYTRVFDPLYAAIFWRSVWIAALSTLFACCSDSRWRSTSRARRGTKRCC